MLYRLLAGFVPMTAAPIVYSGIEEAVRSMDDSGGDSRDRGWGTQNARPGQAAVNLDR